MSLCDENFANICNEIIKNGSDTSSQSARPHWEDGTPAYTLKKFGVVIRYDLRKEFPIMTLRPVPVKNCIDELLWIWQKKSNRVSDLRSHIWDSWADEEGTIGAAYGYQLSKKYEFKDVTIEGLENAFGENLHIQPYIDYEFAPEKRREYQAIEAHNCFCTIWMMDQVDKVIYDLKNNPFSRRIMTNLYDFEDLHDMNLYPCAYSMTFNVTEENGQLILNGILNQRSQDMLTAFAWNEFQYAILLAFMAKACGMIPGEFMHVIADAHIYDRHVDIVKEMIQRPSYPAPKVRIADKYDFYSFTPEDVTLIEYQKNPQIKGIPVAV